MHTHVIAEIGANHGGSLETGFRLIEVAAEAGCWGVKTQIRGPSYLHESLRSRPYSGPHSFGETYGEHRDALELNKAQHAKLAMRADGLGLKYGVSVWDEESIDYALNIGVDFLKIPSAEAGNIPFVEMVSSKKIDVIASVGMCNWDQIVAVVNALEDSQRLDGHARVLMHCVSAYPCDEGDLCLGSVSELAGIVDPRKIAIGFSDHSKGISMAVAARALGATWIEKHITLDRTSKGTDHAASLEPDGLKRMCRDLGNLGRAMPRVKAVRLECEDSPCDKLVRTAVADRDIMPGTEVVPGCVTFQACGIGIAGLKPSDVNKGRPPKARHMIVKGEVIRESDVVISARA